MMSNWGMLIRLFVVRGWQFILGVSWAEPATGDPRTAPRQAVTWLTGCALRVLYLAVRRPGSSSLSRHVRSDRTESAQRRALSPRPRARGAVRDVRDLGVRHLDQGCTHQAWAAAGDGAQVGASPADRPARAGGVARSRCRLDAARQRSERLGIGTADLRVSGNDPGSADVTAELWTDGADRGDARQRPLRRDASPGGVLERRSGPHRRHLGTRRADRNARAAGVEAARCPPFRRAEQVG